MSDLGILICILAFGLFCGGIGALSHAIITSTKMDDLKITIYQRLVRAYGTNSAPARLFQREFLD